jgi:hypothetical protein
LCTDSTALVYSSIHQLLVNAGGVNILGGSVHSIKKNAEGSVVASKEIGLEVNAEKAKYMVMPRDQNAGKSHNIKLGENSFETVQIYGNNPNESKFHS